MRFFKRVLLQFVLASLGLVLVSSLAFADSAKERTQFGHDITVGQDEEVGEVTCFGCNVRVRGHVSSEVTVFGGSVFVEDQGEIASDVSVFGGNIRLDKGAQVGGDVALFGGRMHRDPEAAIRGDVSIFGSSAWLLLIFGLPLLLLGAFIALIVFLVRLALRPSVPVVPQPTA